MANPKIEVEVSSNIDQLKKGFSDSEAQVVAFGNKIDALKKKFDSSNGSIDNLKNRLSQLKKNLEGATDIRSIAKYNIRIRDTEDELDRLSSVGLRVGNSLKIIPNSLAKTTVGVNQLQRATSGYNGVGIEFSRIIQDAPFGIMGVGNNITRLAETFQQLRTNSTSTGAALKTALSSIISPANLLVLGISAVTTAFTLYSMGAFDSKDATEELTDATTKAKEELDKYVTSLDGVAKASLTGASATQNELSALKGLQIQAENLNIEDSKRIEAVDELQKRFPDYLGNLTQEQILTGDVGSAYSELTKQLIATGKARASVDSIAKNSIEILQLETRERERLEKIKALEIQQAGASTFNSAQSGVIGGNLFSEADILAAKVRDIQKEGIEDRTRIGDLIKENLNLESLITKEIEKGGSFTQSQKDETEKLAKSIGLIGNLTAQINSLNESRSFANDQEEINLLDSKISKLQDQLKLINTISERANQEILPSVGVLSPRENPFTDITAPTITGVIIPPPRTDLFKAALDELSDYFEAYSGDFLGSFQDLVLNINDTIENNLTSAFSNLGNDLGIAIAQGTNIVQALGKSLLNSIGSFLSDLGVQLIAFGVAGIAFSSLIEAIKKGGPLSIPAGIAAIAAGTALVAIGSAFRSTAGKGVGGGGSGGGGGGGSVGAGVNSQAYTGSGLERSMNFEFVPLKIQGSDIYYSLEQQSKKRNQG